MPNKVKVQYLEIDLYEGFILVNKTFEVSLSRSIPQQVMEQYVEMDNENRDEIIEYMMSNLKSVSTGYKLHGDEILYHIILPK